MDYHVGQKLLRFYTEHDLQNTADWMQVGWELCVANEHSSLLREQRSLPVQLPGLHVGQVRPEEDIVFICLYFLFSIYIIFFRFPYSIFVQLPGLLEGQASPRVLGGTIRMTRSSVVCLLSTIFYEGETQEVIKRYYVTQCGRLRATEVIVLAWDTTYSNTLWQMPP